LGVLIERTRGLMNATTPRLGDEGAFSPSPRRELWTAYVAKRSDLVRFFAARLGSHAAAEDLIQDLFLRIETLEIQAPIDNPSAFLYRTAVNLMLDRLRGERRTNVRDRAWHDSRRIRVGGADVADEPSPEQATESRERMRRLVAAVEHLPPHTRRAFELHKFDGHSHAETARILGVSRKTVEKQVSAALKHITLKLGDM
jgi:RNA polymerase sigma factor (sigma-70 family)